MTEHLHPADVLDDMSRRDLRAVLVIGIDRGNRLQVSTTETLEDALDLASIVAMGFADREKHEAKIRMMHA